MSEYELSAFTSTKGLSSDSKFDPMVLLYILIVVVVISAVLKFTSKKKTLAKKNNSDSESVKYSSNGTAIRIVPVRPVA